MTVGTGLHQQGRDSALDLVQGTVEQVQQLARRCIEGVGAAIGVDGHEHTPQGVVDLMGDAGSDPAHRGQALGLDHALFQGLLLAQGRDHGVELAAQLADLAIALRHRALQSAWVLPADAGHASRQVGQRGHHAPSPQPTQRQDHRQAADDDQGAANQDLAQAWQVGGIGEQADQFADLGAIAGERQV